MGRREFSTGLWDYVKDKRYPDIESQRLFARRTSKMRPQSE